MPSRSQQAPGLVPPLREWGASHWLCFGVLTFTTLAPWAFLAFILWALLAGS